MLQVQKYPENIQVLSTSEETLSFYGDFFSTYSAIDTLPERGLRVINHEFVFPCADSVPASGVALKPEMFQPPEGNHSYIFSFFNNHCNDFDLNSLVETQRVLELAGHICIPSAQMTKNCLVIEHVDGPKVGIAFVCEGETFAQKRDIPDIMLTSAKLIDDQVTQLKKICDIVVVFIHWGDEFHLVPNNRQFNLGKNLIDKGCLVIGHHAHIPQIYFSYGNRSRIYFGLGNYRFDDLTLENNSQKMERRWRFFNSCSISVKLDLRSLEVTHDLQGASRRFVAIFIVIFKTTYILHRGLSLYGNKKIRSLFARLRIRWMN